MADYAGLQTEIALPAYLALNDTQIAASLNGNTISTFPSPCRVAGADIFNAIVPLEFSVLSAATQQFVRDVWSLATVIDLSVGTNALSILQSAFGPGSLTRTNLANLIVVRVSRASQLGFSYVTPGDIVVARSGRFSTP